MQNITAIIVSYKTPLLLRQAYESFRVFYPNTQVIIIDGSPPDSECWAYALSLQSCWTNVRCVEYNIGHGNGMKMGISMCHTDYFLLMDSDVEINKPCLEEMLTWLKPTPRCYGIGKIVTVNEFGGNCDKDENSIPYLHPHFALINKAYYLKCDPIINHGAPMLQAMKSVIKNKLTVKNYNVELYVTHHERGTRKLNPPEFNPVNWDMSKFEDSFKYEVGGNSATRDEFHLAFWKEILEQRVKDGLILSYSDLTVKDGKINYNQQIKVGAITRISKKDFPNGLKFDI